MSEMGGYGGGGYGGGGYGGYGGGGGYGGFGGGGSNPFHWENMCFAETCELKLLFRRQMLCAEETEVLIPNTAGNVRPGDWSCPNCSANVFASKAACYRCNTPKPESGGGGYGGGGFAGAYGGEAGGGGGLNEGTY
jgi:RNA-binding protein FUS